MTRSLIALLLVTGVAAAEPPKPAVVVRSRNFAKLFDDYSHMVAAVVGEKGRKALQDVLEDDLGAKGLKGLDQTRPWAGYLLATDKLEDTAFVLLVPVTKESDFLDMLDRLDFTAEEVPGATGLYEIEWPGASLFLRFHEKYAYLGVNATRAGMDTKALIASKQLLDPDDLTPVAVTVYPERLSKEWRNAADEMAKMIVGPGSGPEAVPGILLRECLTRLQDNSTGLEPVRVAAEYDRERGEVVVEMTATGAKGTPLAADIAARKPADHRFAGIAGTAATFRLCWPALGKPAREVLAEFVRRSGGVLALDLDADTILTPPAVALTEAIRAAVATSAADFAVAVDGPDKAGHYAATFAVGIGNGKKLDAAIRSFVTAMPVAGDADVGAVQNAVTLDAAKIADVTVHSLKLGEFLPKEWKELLGDTAEVAVAVTKDAAFVTVGTDAVGRMKAALAAKPAASDPLTLTVTPKALAPLLDKLGMPNHLGESDKPQSLLGATLTGGDSLGLRAAFNLKLLAPFYPRE